ncbi:glycosyltransferase involved in cell wall biosynthesis [Pseudoscardovia suis]|uniref:Glycosyl transferase n=1 Tax=Pseudoscardovia suis TaxID=987063 RepID=A0A261F1J8_9BIFI|nr:glycosyltransferase [Pseudoscardovia suis]OZG52994.1 glycosyl transferase [Pseudoscardovia suis]PJJ68500.1 glycosyltransferase involved in cell wall biosynthesis [Pseudoscardovia suis]
MGKAEHTTGVKGAKAVDRQVAQSAQAASDSPLTIALVVDTAGNEGNGTSNSALQYARELRRQGHVVRLVGIGSPEYPVAQRHIPLVSWVAAKQQMQFAQPDAEMFRKAFQGADVVHVYLPFKYGRAAVRTAHEMGIPATAGFHLQPENVLYSAGPLRYVPGASAFLYWLFDRMLYRHIRHIHTPSHMIAAQLRAHGYRQRLHVISNGYAPRFTPKQQREPGSPSPRPFRIVASGRLASEKDHATLIRAVALSRHAKDIELLICGTGPLQRELRHMAAELLPGRWSIGFHDNAQMPALLRSCDLLVHPSIVDIESLSVLEGMASGLVPVIAKSAQSAAGQFALTDRSLFDARDPVMLAQRIDWWIEHPDELSHWGAVYAEHTHEEYSIESCVHKFVAMEREAIADFDGVL